MDKWQSSDGLFATNFVMKIFDLVCANSFEFQQGWLPKMYLLEELFVCSKPHRPSQ